MAVALFDLDNSLVNYNEALVKSLNELRSPEEQVIKSLFNIDKLPHMRARIKLIRNSPGWWKNLLPLYEGFAIYKIATDIGFTNIILSKATTSPISWAEKYEWCQKRFGIDVNIHLCSNVYGKSGVDGKVFYDDWPDYMKGWLTKHPRGLGIMPLKEYNKDYIHPNVIKFNGNNIEEVENALKIAFTRKPGEYVSFKQGA